MRYKSIKITYSYYKKYTRGIISLTNKYDLHICAAVTYKRWNIPKAWQIFSTSSKPDKWVYNIYYYIGTLLSYNGNGCSAVTVCIHCALSSSLHIIYIYIYRILQLQLCRNNIYMICRHRVTYNNINRWKRNCGI